MGRGYDFTPLRVHRKATQLLALRRSKSTPWLQTVGDIPPTQTLIRTQPIPHQLRSRNPKTRKPSRLFQPTRIEYEEDELRRKFFGDHPWELARPRVVLENDGMDHRKSDWSRLRQPGRALDGESVVQRQKWLLQNAPELTAADAYDRARREFYALRYEEDVERRVAKEEALSTGAYFGKSHLEVGMELEDKTFEEWKEWAAKEALTMQQARAGAQSGAEIGETDLDPTVEVMEAGLETDDSTDISQGGQETQGSAMVRP